MGKAVGRMGRDFGFDQLNDRMPEEAKMAQDAYNLGRDGYNFGRDAYNYGQRRF